MDYDEWTPLGRGDPLKNSPTFDYVPPVLDRVQYWLDSQQQHTTEPSSKRDILVLGVTAKKTSPKIPEQFLKFVDGPKFTRTASQDPTLYRNDFTGSIGAEPPKLVRTTNFRNGLVDYRNQNRLQSLPASYYPNPYYSQKMKPYTMMMPPPMVQKAETSTSYGMSKDKVLGYDVSQPFSTQTEEGPILQDTQYYGVHFKDYEHYSPAPSSRPYPTSRPSSDKIETIKSVYVPSAMQSTKPRYEATTASTVSFEKSNLIYQSTQTLSGGWLGNNGPTSSSTEFSPDVNQVTWKTADYSKDHYEIDHHAAASSNHEVVVGQNANIIVDGTNNENEEVVVGQKEISSETTSSSTFENITQTFPASVTTADSAEQKEEDEAVTDAESSQKMHIVVANSPSGIADLETHKAKKGPVAVVMPTNYVEKNATSSSDPPTTLHNNAWENPVTSEMTKTTHQTSKPQSEPMRNAVTSLPILTEEDRQSSSSVPNRIIMPSPQLPHQSSPSSSPMMPPRHVANSPHMFLPPQAVSQYMLRTQNRPNHMMHLIGNMRPGFRPSSPISMFHMSPPMTQVHALPMKGMMAQPNMEQLHQRPSQPFPVTFTSPPSPPTTLNAQATESDEQSVDHTSRLPTTTANAMTTTTSPSLVSSSVESTSITDTAYRQESTRHDQSPLVKIFSTEKITHVPSSTVPPRTTTAPSLTTDPIFSHYKQPAKPIRGPMYLIIQGHSKVKTYKPTVNKHGVPVENNEIAESATERQLSKLDQLIHENTKNGIVDLAAEKKKKLEEKARAEKQRQLLQQESLMSLVESGLSGFTVSPSTKDEHRASKSVTSIEIN